MCVWLRWQQHFCLPVRVPNDHQVSVDESDKTVKDEQTQFAVDVHQMIMLLLNIEDVAKVWMTIDTEKGATGPQDVSMQSILVTGSTWRGETALDTQCTQIHAQHAGASKQDAERGRPTRVGAQEQTALREDHDQQDHSFYKGLTTAASWTRRRDCCERCPWLHVKRDTVERY